MSWTKKVPMGKERIGYLYREALVHKLCNVSHFLPKTFDVTIKDETLTIKMEKLETNLKNPTDENKIKSWKNVLQAVAVLNYFGIAHRDIKTDNIMYRNGEEAVLIDFGLSKALFDGFHTPNIVSDFYRPPELFPDLEVQKYSFEVDSWSLGVWALEMWNDDFDHVLFKSEWKKGNTMYIENIPEKLKKIVSSFLLPTGERKTVLDWVKIEPGKKLFTFPKDFKCIVPKKVIEWETAYKSFYWSLSQYFKNDKFIEPMTLWACSLLVLPFEFDPEELCKDYNMPESMLTSRVLEWFVNWKIQKE